MSGGKVSNAAGFVSNGAVAVDGAGSTWTNSGGLYAGLSGNGTLNITNGGAVGSGTITAIGFVQGKTGAATVDGAGSALNSVGSLLVGDVGTGTLNVRNNGSVSAGAVIINGLSMIAATNNGVLNTGTLTGAGTIRLDNGGGATALTINQSGNSTFGGMFTKTGAGVLTLGQAPTNTGGFAVNGGGLVLPANATLNLAATGTLTAASGATIDYTGLTVNGGTIAGAGTHTVGAGATFVGTNIAAGATVTQTGAATVNGGNLRGRWNAQANLAANNLTVNRSGTLAVNAGTTTANDLESLGAVTVGSGATLAATGSGFVSGGATNIGAGGKLTGDVQLVGGTLTNNGTMRGGMTTVSAGGVLKGAGTFGDYVLTEFGVFSPGNSPGTANTGNATWNGGGRFLFEIANANGVARTDWDLNNVAGSLSLVAGSQPFTIRVDSLLANNAAGALSNFDSSGNYVWDIVRTTGGVSGVPAGFFALDTAGFAALNPGASTGAWSVGVAANTLQVRYAGAAVVPEAGTGALVAGIGCVVLGVGVGRLRGFNGLRRG